MVSNDRAQVQAQVQQCRHHTNSMPAVSYARLFFFLLVMGRSAGYIAAHATMASSDIDLCLVPEVPTVLEGEDGCLPHLMRRVKEQGYAVVVVAEGAGEDVLGISAEVDAGGNRKLPAIGEFMKKQVEDYFVKHGDVATVKYIDPSYTVRSVPANAADSLCKKHHNQSSSVVILAATYHA